MKTESRSGGPLALPVNTTTTGNTAFHYYPHWGQFWIGPSKEDVWAMCCNEARAKEITEALNLMAEMKALGKP